MRKVLALAAFLLLALPGAARRADPLEERFKAADVLIEKGDYAGARDELLTARTEFKDDDERFILYHERTGASWLREGRVKEDRRAFTAALLEAKRLGVADQSVARAYAGLGLCLRRENKDQLALRFFKKALGERPDEGTWMFVEDQIREIEGAPPLPP